MANPYLTVDGYLARYDQRTQRELSGDDNARQGNIANIQLLLDEQASEMESYFDGRYNVAQIQALNPMPPILSKVVGCLTQARLFARRTTVPKEVVSDTEWAKYWLTGVMEGKWNVPTVPRAYAPVLVDSDSKTGASEFDWVFGTAPSPTGPTGNGTPATNQGWNPGGGW